MAMALREPAGFQRPSHSHACPKLRRPPSKRQPRKPPRQSPKNTPPVARLRRPERSNRIDLARPPARNERFVPRAKLGLKAPNSTAQAIGLGSEPNNVLIQG